MEYCDYIFEICQQPKEWANLWLAFAAMFISAVSLIISIRFANKSFRPIVSIAVKTHIGGNVSILYNLEVLNSGSIPAKNIQLKVENRDISNALGNDKENTLKNNWLACFDENSVIKILQNGSKTSCSFGMTQKNDSGFWKYGVTIPVVVEYIGWFGKHYCEKQQIHIHDSNSFTHFMWGTPD